MKLWFQRIQEALDYLHDLGEGDLARHIQATVNRFHRLPVGRSISLGARADGNDDPQYAENTRKRKALRALLLCQRVYFSSLWSRLTLVGGARQPHDFLTRNWKNDSLAHWRHRTEAEIVEGIRSFCVTSNGAADLAEAANGPPNGGHPDLTFTRDRDPFPGLRSCYGSVMTWLFKSGLASYRWYMRHSGACNQQTLREAFGPARVIWNGDRRFGPSDRLPRVPRGHIVHLFVDNPIRWNGHWLVSLGDGNARACNNDTTDGTPNAYAGGCSLDNQFLHGYKHALEGARGGAFEQGVAEVIDPVAIPERL